MDRLDRLPAPTGTDLDVEAFYVGLSAAVRAYLSDRLNVPAREQTTAEIVATLRDQDRVSAAARKRIRAVLEVADLVKFADSRPSPSDNETALREARAALRTIEDTVRPEAATETDTGS
jgi:hypothetical protein